MEFTDVVARFTIKAQHGPGALEQVTTKIGALAPNAASWTIRPIAVRPAGKPDADGHHVGPPWLFEVEVTCSVPVPEGP